MNILTYVNMRQREWVDSIFDRNGGIPIYPQAASLNGRGLAVRRSEVMSDQRAVSSCRVRSAQD